MSPMPDGPVREGAPHGGSCTLFWASAPGGGQGACPIDARIVPQSVLFAGRRDGSTQVSRLPDNRGGPRSPNTGHPAERSGHRRLTVESGVEYDPHMQTIQVVLEDDLLRHADRAARRAKVNRSAFIREALRQHLKRLNIEELERREREGYLRTPDDDREYALWEAAAAWPEP